MHRHMSDMMIEAAGVYLTSIEKIHIYTLMINLLTLKICIYKYKAVSECMMFHHQSIPTICAFLQQPVSDT